MNNIQIEKLLNLAYDRKYNDPANSSEIFIRLHGEVFPKLEYYSLRIIKGIFSDKLEIFIKYRNENRHERKATFLITNKSYINTVKEIIHNRNKLYDEKEDLTFIQAFDNSFKDEDKK